MTCSICQHSERQAIDQALIAGSATLAGLSQTYGLSTSALHRHKAHLQDRVHRAKHQLHDNLRQGCLFWLSQALEMTMQTAQTAQADGNGRLVLQALAQGTRLVTIILKHDLPLDDRVVFEILSSPDAAAHNGLLPQDPQILTKSRQSLAGIFSSPCSETPPQDSSPAPPGGHDLDALQAVLANLARTPDLPSQPCRRLSKRKKGGKLPGKTPFRKDNAEKNQEDKLFEKIAGMDLSLCIRPNAPGNSKLESLFADRGKIPQDKPLAEYIYEQSLLDSQNDQKRGAGLPAAGRR